MHVFKPDMNQAAEGQEVAAFLSGSYPAFCPWITGSRWQKADGLVNETTSQGSPASFKVFINHVRVIFCRCWNFWFSKLSLVFHYLDINYRTICLLWCMLQPWRVYHCTLWSLAVHSVSYCVCILQSLKCAYFSAKVATMPDILSILILFFTYLCNYG